jgi:hypothetical protein
MTANVSGGTTDNEEEEEDAMVITYCESGEKGSMRAHGFTVNNSRAKYRIRLQSDGLKYYCIDWTQVQQRSEDDDDHVDRI